MFNTKPRNIEGRDFDFGFKIDAFRDQIKFRRNGSEKAFHYNTIAGSSSIGSISRI